MTEPISLSDDLAAAVMGLLQGQSVMVGGARFLDRQLPDWSQKRAPNP